MLHSKIENQHAELVSAATFNAAADSFDQPALGFWDLIGRRTVERLRLKEGARVLDVACGTGASAIPAAERVGPAGSVLAIDLAERLLELGRAKSEKLDLTNIEFRLGDMERLGLPNASFDAVICVFGIFFLDDMATGMRELWRMVRPGGQLAITTWGPRVFEPGSSAFWKATGTERPDLVRSYNPWDRITTPAGLEELFHAAGIEGANITAEANLHPLSSPDDWWTIVLGTGFRNTVEQLETSARERVRAANLDQLTDVRAIEVNALYASATRSN